MEPEQFSQGIKSGFPYGSQIDDYTLGLYRKMAAKFTREVISIAWEMLIDEWADSGNSGYPGLPDVKAFLHRANRLVNPVEYKEASNSFKDAKEYLNERLDELRGHGAFKLIYHDHQRAMNQMYALVRERGWIQAQKICGCEIIGYDPEKAFGYYSWNRDPNRINQQLSHLKSTATEQSRIYFDVEQVAIDWFNGLDYFDENSEAFDLMRKNNFV